MQEHEWQLGGISVLGDLLRQALFKWKRNRMDDTKTGLMREQ